MRKDPTTRLDRRTAGQWLHEPGLVESKLRARDREVRQPRTILGHTKNMREFKVRKMGLFVDPAPNAPQLIRLVRHPFKLHTASPRRIEGRAQVEWPDRSRESTPPLREVFEAEHVQQTWGNPLRRLHHRPAARDRAPIQDWLATRGW